ncbi:MAG: LemA family protein, partial [Candidatus Binatia bacterium]
MNIELLIAGIVVLIIVVGLVGWLVGVYNGLVMRRNDVDKAFANIDVLLKQRADQIPDLMRVVQTAMNHE